MARSAQLIIDGGSQSGQRLSLKDPDLVVGRDPRSSIVLDHPQVSRRHARITWWDTAWVIEDMDGTNGTFVNGKPIEGPCTLVHGDLVGLGEAMVLQFEEGRRRRADVSAPSPRQAQRPTGQYQEEQGVPVDVTVVYPDQASLVPDRRGRSTGESARRGAMPVSTWMLMGLAFLALLLVAVIALILILGYVGVLASPLGPDLGLAPSVQVTLAPDCTSSRRTGCAEGPSSMAVKIELISGELLMRDLEHLKWDEKASSARSRELPADGPVGLQATTGASGWQLPELRV